MRTAECEVVFNCIQICGDLLTYILAMATGIWIVSAELRQFLLGHNADALPSFLIVNGLLTICLALFGYNSAWYSSSTIIEDRFYALKKMMWFELLACFLGKDHYRLNTQFLVSTLAVYI